MAPYESADDAERRAQRNSLVRDSAPHIGSGSSSSADEDYNDKVDLDASEDAQEPESAENAQMNAMHAKLQEVNEELAHLRKAYDLEVQNCADLREKLESQETDTDATNAPLREELASVQAALTDMETTECGAMMRIEDDLGRSNRLLDARNREIKFLERRLHTLQQGFQQLLREGEQDLPDSAAEEALRRTDKEVSALQAGVQLRETQIASYAEDLKNILDFVISTNIDAAGGPAPGLTSEDFLPSGVREHLNLSSHGNSHLAILMRKYGLQMEELKTSHGYDGTSQANFEREAAAAWSLDHGALEPTPAWRDRGSLERAPVVAERALPKRAAVDKHRLQPISGAGQLQHPSESPIENSTYAWGADEGVTEEFSAARPSLVAAGLEDEDDIADLQWQENAEEQLSLNSSERIDSPQAARGGFGIGDVGSPSATFKEESELLLQGLKQEMEQLSEVLMSSTAEERPPLQGLLQAARDGNEGSVKESLSLVGDACLEEALLGWTVWHVAAGAGEVRVLECLKEEAVQRSVHHLVTLSQPTSMGLPPLGVACLQGKVEAVRSLLLGMAPIDSRDARGNTPLFWAIAGGQAETLVPLLLAAHADPSTKNKSGQVPDVADFLRGSSAALPNLDESGGINAGNAAAGAGSAAIEAAREMQFGEPFHHIFALGAQPENAKDKSLLSYTISMLKAPARDAIGFARNARGRDLARLDDAEIEAGVYSCYVTNFTHAGLQSALEAGRPAADPVRSERNQQALVLTCERLLLFHYHPTWSLVQVIALSEIQQLIICSHSATVLVLRMHRVPDVVLDVSHRSRLLDELQLAARKVAAQWGGGDLSNMVQMQSEGEPIVALLDERRKRIGSMAFVEADVFLLLPFVPGSLLMSGGDTFFFGFLDFHQSTGAGWRWHTFLFILKSGPGQVRQLHWCRHPNDVKSVGSIPVDKIRGVNALDTPQDQGGAAMILDYVEPTGKTEALTLRARTVRCREDWITSVRAMETWM